MTEIQTFFRQNKNKNAYLARFMKRYNVLSENISTLTNILLNRAFNKSNRPKSNEKEREEGKEEGEKKKTEHSYVFISSTLESF